MCVQQTDGDEFWFVLFVGAGLSSFDQFRLTVVAYDPQEVNERAKMPSEMNQC